LFNSFVAAAKQTKK